MKIQEIMTQSLKTCTLETNLATAAMEMWDGDCGVIPVVNHEQKVAGVITDRDICIAVATKHRKAEDITVGEVLREAGGKLYFVSPGDAVHKALEMMREHKIRRLPVLNPEGKLAGMLSINDIVLAEHELVSSRGKKIGLTAEDIVNTFKSICQHRIQTVAA